MEEEDRQGGKETVKIRKGKEGKRKERKALQEGKNEEEENELYEGKIGKDYWWENQGRKVKEP